MTDARKIAAGCVAWTALVSGLHLALNVDWSVFVNDRLPEAQRRLYCAYIPVT